MRGFKLGLGYGSGGTGGGVPSVLYILRTLFAGVSGPFTNGQVLDTPAEGVTDGSRTVVDTSTGVITVASDKQSITGTGVANETGIIEASITRESGRPYQCKFTVPTAGDNYFGFHTSAALTTEISGCRVSGTNVYACVGSTQTLVGTVTVGQEYTLMVVLAEAGFLLYIEGGSEYTTGTLLFVGGTDATATLHPQNQNVSTVQTLTDAYLISETLFLGFVTPFFLDPFIEGSNTLLVNHDPTIPVGSNAWVDVINTPQIFASANAAMPQSGNTQYIGEYDVEKADKYQCCKIKPISGADHRVYVRFIDTNNFVAVFLKSSDKTVRIYVRDDGVADTTTVASGNYTDGVIQSIDLIAHGSEITLYWNGETLVKDYGTPTTPALNTTTSIGLQLFAPASNTSGVYELTDYQLDGVTLDV